MSQPVTGRAPDMPSTSISFVASTELRDALDALAFENHETRSAAIRAVFVEAVQESGLLNLLAPPTHQIGKTNRRYNPKGGRA